MSLTSGYHPQSNSRVELWKKVERCNQEIGRYLSSYRADNQNNWVRFLPSVVYAQNSLRHPATKMTPFQCVLGFQPPLFPWNATETEVPAVDDWFRRSDAVCEREPTST